MECAIDSCLGFSENQPKPNILRFQSIFFHGLLFFSCEDFLQKFILSAVFLTQWAKFSRTVFMHHPVYIEWFTFKSVNEEFHKFVEVCSDKAVSPKIVKW